MSFESKLSQVRGGYRAAAGRVRYSVLMSAIQKFARRGAWSEARPVAAALAALAYKDRSAGYKSNITNIINRSLVIVCEDHRGIVDIRKEIAVLRNQQASPDDCAAAVVKLVYKLTAPGLVKSRRCSAYKALCLNMNAGCYNHIEEKLGTLEGHRHVTHMARHMFDPTHLKSDKRKPLARTRHIIKTYLLSELKSSVPQESQWAFDYLVQQLMGSNHKEWFLFPIRAALLVGEKTQPQPAPFETNTKEFVVQHFDPNWTPPPYVLDIHTGKRKNRETMTDFITSGIFLDNPSPQDKPLLEYYIACKHDAINKSFGPPKRQRS